MSSPGVLRELPCEENLSSTSSLSNKFLNTKIEHFQYKKSNDKKVDEITHKFSDIFLTAEQLQNNVSESNGFDKILSTINSERRKRTRKKPPNTLKKLRSEMHQYLQTKSVTVACVESSSISKMLALVDITCNNELEACCNLIASHAVCLRQQILLRNLKSKIRSQILNEPLNSNLDPEDLDIDNLRKKTNANTLIPTLQEMPTEWYVLQVTSIHEHLKSIRHRFQQGESMYSLKPMHGLHLIVLPTGDEAMEPICITLPKPNANSNYDVCIEIETVLNNNKSDLTAAYSNNDLYWKMREKQNDKMSTAIAELEFSWLREWRILLLADYTENLDLVQDIYSMLNKLIADSSIKIMTRRTLWLLRKIATGACYLQPFEIERAVRYVLPNQEKLAKNIVLSIVAKVKVMNQLKSAKRKPLILIVDESLDHLSFESITLLKHQPVSRFPSLHIAYALFRQHKNTLEGGYKVIKKANKFGTFIVNPSVDLVKMEVRIRSFIEYWLPTWEGIYGVKPDFEHFKDALTKFQLLMYNGHGSGIQFFRGEDIERMRVLASVLLFGCSSIKLLPLGGRLPSYGISNQYLMSCSPCVLGMLWEVTDGEIDKMTAEFLSSWIPSKAKRSWSDVNKTSWHQGKIEFQKGSKNEIKNEQDMLVAVAKAKDVCKQYMTSAAIIVRGLPVKLVD